MSNPTQKQLQQAIDAVFGKYDKDHSGYLDTSELQGVLSDVLKRMDSDKKITPEYMDKFLSIIDQNSDGKINKSQFLQIFKKLSRFH